MYVIIVLLDFSFITPCSVDNDQILSVTTVGLLNSILCLSTYLSKVTCV